MAKEKTVYVCSNCGQDSPKWVGKCPSCGMWNTYVEEVVRKEVVNKRPVSGIETAKAKPVTLHEIVADDEPRIDLHDAELNRVLGGGLVQGSLVLIGGEPGIGKSTLVLQTVLRIPEKRILYVSGEESTRQLKLRADRLTSASSDCLIVCETSWNRFTSISRTSARTSSSSTPYRRFLPKPLNRRRGVLPRYGNVPPPSCALPRKRIRRSSLSGISIRKEA